MRKLHRWLGIPIAIAMLYMSLSGILLNHPRLIAAWNAPSWLLPSDMRSVNWGRGAIQAWTELDDGAVLAGGKGGLHLFRVDQQTPEAFGQGIPASVYDGAIQTLHRDSVRNELWAGTPAGLFRYDRMLKLWKRESVDDDVRAVASNANALYAFGATSVWRYDEQDWQKIRSWGDTSFSLIRLVFDLHSGAVLGKPGKLLYDIAALALFALGIGGLYLLLAPHIARRLSRRIKKSAAYLVRYHYHHHRRWGWILLIPMIIIPFTGFFMKAPVSALLVRPPPSEASIGMLSAVQWDADGQRWILADGKRLWQTDAAFTAPFQPLGSALPVHPMGITGMIVRQDTALIGSFSGILRHHLTTGESRDYFTGREIVKAAMYSPWQIRAMAPLGNTIAVSELRRGWFRIDNSEVHSVFPVPPELRNQSTYSLWHWLFELHNGRILRSWLPRMYMLHNPIVALGTLLVVLSGVVLIWRRRRRH